MGIAARRDRFHHLFHVLRPRIIGLLRQKGAPDLIIEDLCQESFVTLWRHLERLPNDPEAVRRWLFAVASARLRNHWRSRHRSERLVELIALNHRHLVHVVEGRLIAAEAWEELHDSQKHLFLRRSWDGVSNEQLADELACSKQAVEKRVSRARKQLADSAVTWNLW